MTSLRLSHFAFVAFVALTACSGAGSGSGIADTMQTSPTDAGPGSAHPPGAGGSDAGAGSDAGSVDASAPACTTLADISTGVTLMTIADAAPAPAGGIVHDGTYVLTSAALYVGPGGPSGPTTTKVHMTIRIAGTMLERNGDQGGPTSGTIAPSGTALTSTDTCPDDATRTEGFTADETSVTAYIATTGPGGAAATLVETFTKP